MYAENSASNNQLVVSENSKQKSEQETSSFSTKVSKDKKDNVIQVSNNEFIVAIFKNIPEGASPAICSKPGNPEQGGWKPRPVSQVIEGLYPESNNYINCSSFYESEDRPFSVKITSFAALHFLVLDDVGTKVPMEPFDGFEPSWLIETSPGNHQIGIVLDKPIADKATAEGLIKAIIRAGLTDPGASGVSRWARLPVGINGKPKNSEKLDKYFRCRTKHWNPARSYSVQEIIAGLKLNVADNPNPVLKSTVFEAGTDANLVIKETNSAQSSESNSKDLARLKKLLENINPDVDYQEWLSVLMVIFNVTGGSDEGLELADDWSKKGEKYNGLDEIKSKWKSFNLNHENPVTIATLCKMVKDGEKNWKITCDAVTPEFKVLDFETETINSSTPSKIEHVLISNIETLASEQNTISSHPAIPSTDANVIITSLAAMSPLEYDRIRLEKAKELGVQAKTLDAQVKKLRNQKADANNLLFPEIEPFPDPINLALLLDEISEIICRFVILDAKQADTAALWIAHTYLIDIIDISPIAIINAPEKACAKTLFQTLLARMAYRPMPAANASVSALFRAVELWKPTILFDEADTFFRENKELQGLINAGYKRGGYVLRSESTGESFEPRMFSVYSAKSIAGISLERHLPDSTMSRGIIFNMRRKLAHESVTRMRHAESQLFEIIVSKLTRFAIDYAQQVRLAQPKLPDELSDRDQDNWEALLAIAECAGPEWLHRATAAALALSFAKEGSVSTGNELLEDIQGIFGSKRVEKISTADLIEALIAIEESAWATYNRGKPITPRQLAKMLVGYGIKSKTVRLGHANTPKGYDKGQFEDVFARYLSAKLPQQCNDSPEANSDGTAGVADNTQHSCNDYLALESLSGNCDGDADKSGDTLDPADEF